MTPFYESDDGLSQYLLFHYGTAEQICPLLPEARMACGFPMRCVTEPMKFISLSKKSRALDLGCAVGRSSFELGRHFQEVVGIDFSQRFVDAARQMGKTKIADVRAPREGNSVDEVRLELPSELKTEHVQFEQGDACALREDLGTFDLVLMANLIDRLPDPAKCLARVSDLISADGWLVVTSPYTWLEEYTPRDKWLLDGEGSTLGGLKQTLGKSFDLKQTLDVSFLIREHRRKYQWSIAEASVWRKR